MVHSVKSEPLLRFYPKIPHQRIGTISASALLQAMIQYGEHVLQFENDIDKTTYHFENLCCNARSYMNTNDHITLKEMSSQIIKPKKTIYQKQLSFTLFTA